MSALSVLHYRYKLLIALLVLLPLLIVLPPLLWPQDNAKLFQEAMGGPVPPGLKLTAAYRENTYRERVLLFILKQDAAIPATLLSPQYAGLQGFTRFGELQRASPDDVAYGISIFPNIVPRQWKRLELYLTSAGKSSGYINIIYDKDSRTVYLITISQ